MSRFMPRRLTVLFVLMTVAAIGGPFLIALVFQGGPGRAWPPDRPVEWAVLLGTTALVVALLVLTIASSMAFQKAEARARAARSSLGAKNPTAAVSGPADNARP
jgi:hypothetical protein